MPSPADRAQVRFLHAADIHLDSPLRGLENYEGAPVGEIREATRRALSNLVQLALDEDVDFVLIAGDLYDCDWPDYNTGLFFANQMARLKEAGIPVVTIAGNHDAANKMTRNLSLPDNVTALSVEEPQTVEFKEIGVMVHGQGFATAAVMDDLSLRYPDPDRGYFNIGLLHTNANGSKEHDPYAPCTMDGLRSKNYDYWALGHIHKREMLIDAGPVVAYSGNTQGRHIRETGPKGCLIVDVDENRETSTQRFEPLDVVRWERCPVVLPDASGSDELLDAFADALPPLLKAAGDRLLALRVEFEAPLDRIPRLRTDPHWWANEVRARALYEASGRIWVEKVKARRTPTDNPPEIASGAIAELRAVLSQCRNDPEAFAELTADLADLRKKLHATLGAAGETGELLETDDPARRGELLDDVEELLIGRCLGGEAE